MENWKAVELVKDFLFGLGLYALISLFGAWVSPVLAGNADGLLLNDQVRGEMAGRMFLWMTVPAFLLAGVLAWFRRIKGRNEALRLCIIWTLLLLFLYLIAALSNGYFTVVIASVPFYVLLIGVFAGPVAYSFLKKLPAS